MFFDEFTKSQLASWPLAEKIMNVCKMLYIERLILTVSRYMSNTIQTVFNSAVAKIDEQSLKARACFLCKENMPAEQASLDYNSTLDIRVNPYPIFERHYTVPAKSHTPQLIKGHFKDMMAIAQTYRIIRSFTTDPKSGASAPDIFISN